MVGKGSKTRFLASGALAFACVSAWVFPSATVVSAQAAGFPAFCLKNLRTIEEAGAGSEKADPPRFAAYRKDTEESLDRMRNPATGLVRDKILVADGIGGPTTAKILNPNTSATNIGLDLLNQLAALENPETAKLARKNLGLVLTSLEAMKFHRESGLFFSWYSTEKGLRAVVKDVSSVDNVHLALALWTIRKTLPGTALARRAGKLFERMDFSVFFDAPESLLWGNLKYAGGKWTPEAYHFSNFGSEARTIYALAAGLGLIKKSSDPAFAEKAIAALTMESYVWRDGEKLRPILRTWDGGAFQLLLPKLLLNEEVYSEELAKGFANYADYVLSEGERLHYPVPAAFSASNFGIDGSMRFGEVPSYVGRSGSLDLVSTAHVEAKNPEDRALWSSCFTPHAAILASTAAPGKFAETLRKMETLGQGGERLYVPGYGFMDGYHVTGPYAGKVVPVVLSLDQGMIALSLAQVKAADGFGPSGRALWNDPIVRERLRAFYRLVDEKLRRTHAP